MNGLLWPIATIVVGIVVGLLVFRDSNKEDEAGKEIGLFGCRATVVGTLATIVLVCGGIYWLLYELYRLATS